MNADIIMLDNMSVADMTRAVGLIEGRAKVEASGGIRLETIRPIAETGVDYISTSKITQAAPAGGLTVHLSSSNTGEATIPSTVTIAAGQTSGTFTISSCAVSTPTPTPSSPSTPLTGADVSTGLGIGIPLLGLGALLGAVALFGLVRRRREDI